jgi:2-methylisocitrate lyase-like PEP mutase family enzyme
MTARLFEKLNFPAIATTSGGIAWSLGYPDGEHAPFDQVMDVIGRIARSVGVPVTADIEAVYGQNDNECFDQTVLRAKAYLAAGADCIFPITLVDKETLKALVGAVDAPINVAAQAGMPNVAELRMTGIARLSTASRLATVALAAIERAINEFRETGRFESLEPAIPRPDVQRMMENN